jgi:iron complex transport system ATP-binding protein
MSLAAHGVHVRPLAAERDVLRDLSLTVARGEILALVGPNGSGKSTALATLGQALAPRLGRVDLDGRDVARIRGRTFAREVARLPQQPLCPDGLTVAGLVACGRHAHRAPLDPLGKADRDAIREAMRAVDLVHLAHRRVDTLSGGERRRAWIALVLCQRAPLLLLDEPTAALDLRHQWEVLILLRRLRDERNVTVAVVLHDLAQAAWIGDRVVVLHRGRVYACGAPRDCITPDMLRDVYGVAATVAWDADGCLVRVLGPADPVRSL